MNLSTALAKPSSALEAVTRRAALHLGAGVDHGDAQPGVREHQHVVRHVADGGDGFRRDPVLR
jgi:hypothetical protein